MAEQLYLLGHPVGHSKSPAMYAAAYPLLGLDWEYSLMDCADEADAWEFISARKWLSINVTTPWKQLAVQAGHEATPEARAAHGANLLVNSTGGVLADNVDGKGCVAFLQRSGFAFEGARVAVCGTGPTARAIAVASLRSGAGLVTLFGRDAARCAKVVEDCRDALWGQAGLEGQMAASSYDGGADALADAQLIVDATPLGMNAGDPAPFDTGLLHGGQTVLDVVYGHGTTALVASAQAAGCSVHDGRGMLVGQAVETLRVLSESTGAFTVPDELDLYQAMSTAAGFGL